jgi:hypothetical protein
MDFVSIVRRYQEADPVTGLLTVTRTNKEYADLLRVDPVIITRLYKGRMDWSPMVFLGLIREFPQSRAELITWAVTADVSRSPRRPRKRAA